MMKGTWEKGEVNVLRIVRNGKAIWETKGETNHDKVRKHRKDEQKGSERS